MRESTPFIWYGARMLEFVPPHFVKSNTPLSDNSHIWVMSKLSGRYAVIPNDEFIDVLTDNKATIYFEDPAEAMLYELRWSGN